MATETEIETVTAVLNDAPAAHPFDGEALRNVARDAIEALDRVRSRPVSGTQDEDHEAGRTWMLLICSHCGAEAGGGAHGHSDAPDWHWEKVKVAPLSRTSVPSPVSGTEPEDHVTLLVCRRSGVPTQDCPSPHYACENGCDEEEVEYVRVRPVSGTQGEGCECCGLPFPKHTDECDVWKGTPVGPAVDPPQGEDHEAGVEAYRRANERLEAAVLHIINRISTEHRDDEHGHLFLVGSEAVKHARADLAAPSPASGTEPDTANGEEVCRRCGGPNRPWAAPSPLWNAVIRGGSIDGHDEFGGIICPTCFVVLAEERGIACGWWVEADTVTAELEMVTPSGRTWDPVARRWAEPGGPEPDTAKLVEALKVAADDLDKAANQFEALRQSQEAGYTVPGSINPRRFAEKAARAREALAGFSVDAGKSKAGGTT